MARIPEAEIERLKRDIPVQRLAEAQGVKLRRHGADLLGLCPFHEDREPSLVITPEKNLWHCLGACQAGGSVIDWVMRAEGISFRHAAERLGRELPSFDADSAVPLIVAKPARLIEGGAEDAAVLESVVAYYEATLRKSPEALAYLGARGLDHPDVIATFRLGFANRTLGYHLPTPESNEGKSQRGRLEALGIRRESGHEHFNGSLVIPVFDAAGRVTEMYGRKIGAQLRKGTPAHLYLPGPHRGVWNQGALEESREIVLCESLIDALTFWCAGIRNVTASYGVEGFTQDHWEAFREHRIERVWIAYDRDDAGTRAAEALSEELAAAGIETLRVEFPKGMDANEYARKVTPAAESLGIAVRQASWMRRPRPTVAVPESVAVVVSVEESPAEIIPPFAAVAASPVPELPENVPVAAPVVPVVPLVAAPVIAFEEGAGDELVARVGDRRWRIRGLLKNTSFESLKVNVLVARNGVRGGGVFVDTLELYSARHRAAFIKQASEELGLEERIVKKELGEIVISLEARQEAAIKKALEPKDKPKEITDPEREAALELLRDRHLLDRILADFGRAGIVGEETNKLIGYLAAVSRKLDAPLGVVIQSSSAAGKSSLMDAILSLMPEEERVQYSAMTGQSLFYMGATNLRHKILAIVEEEGAERASYALKLLQSEGELTIASTGKDPATGKLVTQEYRVEGPVMIFLTTTAVDIDEELLNRCLVLTVDEGREQTRAIHARQRSAQTLSGMLGRQERDTIQKLHRNAQRLLRPLTVVNPFAEELTFLDTRTRTRRDHMKYLTLIRTVALLHQYQREVKEAVTRDGEVIRYVEATREDIAIANRLAHEVLGRSLDELPPQTRRLLHLVEAMVVERAKAEACERGEVRFSRREVREATGWGNTQLKIHLGRLVELEYLGVERDSRRESAVYELRYGGEGKAGESFVVGLRDAATLGYDHEWSGPEGEWSGRGRPVVGVQSARGRGDETATLEGELPGGAQLVTELRNITVNGKTAPPTSYVPGDIPSFAAVVA